MKQKKEAENQSIRKGREHMGICLNPGQEGFEEALNSEIYVDKTGLIAYTNRVLGSARKNICVSRPRRFGKTMAAKMLAAYYDCDNDARDLFSGLKISGDKSFDQHLNKYDVFFFNIQHFCSYNKNSLDIGENLQKYAIKELKKKYGDLIDDDAVTMFDMIDDIYRNTDRGFIFIIDEWDCIFREMKDDKEAQRKYLDFLKYLLKDRRYVKLTYMTGILPIKKYGTHSALNMFDEFSMINPRQLADYVGFTEQEVKALCERYHMDFSEARRWYDGYQFNKVSHVYSPKSVADAMWFQEYDTYWTRTETYEALKVYIDMNFDGLKDAIIMMMGGGRCKVDTSTAQNDMITFTGKDEVLTLLVHLGYLAYDSDREEVFVPNLEVEKEFKTAMVGPGWDKVTKALSDSENLLEAAWRGDEAVVAKGIDAVHMDSTSILTYNNENALSCVISLAFYSAKNYYTLVREFPGGKGFADIVFLPCSIHPEKPAMIVELKWDRSAESAISQMKNKRYVKALENYTGEVFLVGINYDKKTKEHQCTIEKIIK